MTLKLRQLFTLFALSMLSLGISLASFTVQASSVVCAAFYDPAIYNELLVQENIVDLARINGSEWFEVVIPHSIGASVSFEYQKVRGWDGVKKAFEDVASSEKQIVYSRLSSSTHEFQNVVRYFQAIAKTFKAKMKARIKDITSLRNKLINRAKTQAKQGKWLSFDQVDDFIGVRFVLDAKSTLLAPLQTPELFTPESIKEFFAKHLKLDAVDMISSVELKGGAEDSANNKFYRAIHITLKFPEDTPVELQLMTESMAAWHSWDHPRVYKAKTKDPDYLRSLQIYSRFWVKMIRLLEDAPDSEIASLHVLKLLQSYRLNADSRTFSRSGVAVWMSTIDRHLMSTLQIQNEDSFLGPESVLTTVQKKAILQTLIKPDIF